MPEHTYAMLNLQDMVRDLIRSGMNQTQIAEQIGCKQPSVSEILNGKNNAPHYTVVMALIALHKSRSRKIKAAA